MNNAYMKQAVGQKSLIICANSRPAAGCCPLFVSTVLPRAWLGDERGSEDRDVWTSGHLPRPKMRTELKLLHGETFTTFFATVMEADASRSARPGVHT